MAAHETCRREDRRSGVKLTKALDSGQARVRQRLATRQPTRARMRVLRTRVATMRIGRHDVNASGVDLDIGKRLMRVPSWARAGRGLTTLEQGRPHLRMAKRSPTRPLRPAPPCA